jgi:hypothetical protein
MRVSIDTEDRRLGFDLMGEGSVGAGSKVSIPGNATVTLKEWRVRKGFGIPETLELVVATSAAVEAGLIANWLYDKLKGRDVKLRIEELEVEVNQGEITRVVKRVIEQSE